MIAITNYCLECFYAHIAFVRTLQIKMDKKPGKSPYTMKKPTHRWHTRAQRTEIIDSLGRRIGYMWPEDFEAILSAEFGRFKWMGDFSRYAGVNRDTVSSYKRGRYPIPKYIALLVLHLQWFRMSATKKIDRPVLDVPWLSDDRYIKPEMGIEVPLMNGVNKNLITKHMKDKSF